MKYNPALDGIRAIAISLILVYHSGDYWHLGGFIGVDVFFVLSGFLITALLSTEFEQSQRIDLKRFYISRAMRLYPNLAVMILCFLAVSTTLWPEANSTKEALLALFYLTDYSIAIWDQPTVLAHTWSLSIEEHFYLVWPLLLPFILRSKRPAHLLLAFYLTATAWRFFNQYNTGWTHAYFRFDTRMSGLLLGGLIAASRATTNKNFGFVGVIGLAFLFLQDAFNTNEGSTINILAAELFTALILTSSTSSGTLYEILSSSPFVTIGKLSYGLYLWHFPAMYWLRGRYDWEATLIIGAGFALLASAITYRLIEAPVRRFRRGMYRVQSTG